MGATACRPGLCRGVLPDSFGSRGLHSQCREADRKVHASRERVADANAARLWLQAQNYVKPDHVSLLGWSSGGVAALWAIRPTAVPHDGSVDFRSAVALYPNCRRLRETAWSARVPTLILIGSADDWTPATTCQQMVAGAHDRSAACRSSSIGRASRIRSGNAPIRLRTGLVNTQILPAAPMADQSRGAQRRAQARAGMAGEIARKYSSKKQALLKRKRRAEGSARRKKE